MTEVFIDSSVVTYIFVGFYFMGIFLLYRLLYLSLCTAANTLCKTFSNEVKFRLIGILYLGIIYFSILHRYFSSYLHD